MVARLGTCEGHKFSASKPSGAIIVSQRTFAPLYRLLKENRHAPNTESSFHRHSLTDLEHLEHCTNRSSIMRNKSHEQPSRTNINCLRAVLKMSVGDTWVSEYQACALLRREQGMACNLSYSLISLWSSLS